MDSKETEKKPFLPSSIKWVVGTAVGIGTGLARFVTDVRSEFYDNTIKGPDFKPKLEAHGIELGRIKSQRRAGELTTKEFITKFHNQKNAFTTETNEFTKELGIIRDGIEGYTKGTLQSYQTLSENVRLPLAFAAFSTCVIGFAGTSMFMNSLASRKKLDTIAKAPHDQDIHR